MEYKVDEDNWYKWKGVKPPERTTHGLTEDEIDEKLKNNLKGHKCSWTQQGPEIFCDVANYRHGIRIGVHKRLTGTGKGGEPLLVEI